MEFRALRVPALTEELAANLNHRLNNLPGAEQFTFNLETQELKVIFNENELTFKTLVQEMTQAGCALRQIDAALLL